MTDWRAEARRIAVENGVNPDLFERLVQAESSFNPAARSKVGAQGFSQLMPATAADLGVDPSDPMQNLQGGARYLRQQIDRFGNVPMALAAYNAGPTRVARAGGIPNIAETQNYVSKIMGGSMGGSGGSDMLGGGAGEDRLMDNMQDQQPSGLLASFGIQKRDEAAGGETALPFYQRGAFKDTMGRLAIGLNSLRLNPDEGLADRVQGRMQQRQDVATANKTVQFLTDNGRPDLAGAVRSGAIDPKEAISVLYSAPKDNSTALMQNYEYALSQGMTPEQARQWVSSGTTVNVGGGDNAFDKAFGDSDAATIAQVTAAGMQAQRNMGKIEQLDTLLQSAPSGAVGGLKSIAGEFGVNTEGLDDIQAAQAMISSLVPEQRQAGSGPMSDADLALFKQSLPRIINQPNGNAMIIGTMRAIAQYDAEGAAIAQKLRAGEIDRATAFQMLQARPNPLGAFRVPQAPQSGGSTMSPDAATNLLLQQ